MEERLLNAGNMQKEDLSVHAKGKVRGTADPLLSGKKKRKKKKILSQRKIIVHVQKPPKKFVRESSHQ